MSTRVTSIPGVTQVLVRKEGETNWTTVFPTETSGTSNWRIEQVSRGSPYNDFYTKLYANNPLSVPLSYTLEVRAARAHGGALKTKKSGTLLANSGETLVFQTDTYTHANGWRFVAYTDKGGNYESPDDPPTGVAISGSFTVSASLGRGGIIVT